jgi:hypothetical protein
LAGSRIPSATTAITATTIIDATTQAWCEYEVWMSPVCRAGCQPAASVQTTTVGMMSSISGISRVVISITS